MHGHGIRPLNVRVSAGYANPDNPQPQASYEVDQEAQRLFAEGIAAAFAGLARGLGRNPCRRRASYWIFLRNRLGFDEGRRIAAAANSLKEALNRDSSLVEACERCSSMPESEHRLLVSALYELARDRNRCRRGPARMVMRDAAQALGMNEADEASLRAVNLAVAIRGTTTPCSESTRRRPTPM